MIGIRHKNEGTVVQKNSQDFLVEFLLADNARFFFAFEESETSRITVIEKADQYLTEMGVRNCSPFSIRVTIYGMVTKYNEGNQLQFDLEKEGMNAEDIESLVKEVCPFYLNFAKYDQKKKPSTPPLNEPPIDKDSVDHPGEGSGAGQKSLSQNDYIDHKKWLALVEENEDVAEDIQLKKKIAKAKVLVEAYIKLVKEEPLSLEEKMSYISNLLDEKLE